MKNLPIKKKIEELLERVEGYTGVWKIVGKDYYLKSTSEIKFPPVKMPIGRNYKKAVKEVLRCARVYQSLVKKGMYHPKTQIVICKDDQDNLALMVLMPELKTNHFEKDIKAMERIQELGLQNRINLDMTNGFNWGYDKKTGEFYAHDLHIGMQNKDILKLASYFEKDDCWPRDKSKIINGVKEFMKHYFKNRRP